MRALEERFWALIVDDCTNYFWSYFVEIKDQLKTKVFESVEEEMEKGRVFEIYKDG
jgi:hypothetical protein